jgi:pimeloyl-ACP methyl ester carboxylesterase
MYGQVVPETIVVDALEVGYERHGDPAGWPVVLLHGFPYDIRAYDEVWPRLVAWGASVVVPYLRGYGLTRFRDPTTLRSGEQAALGRDLLSLLDALAIERAVVAGYDWGGRAACVVSALWPDRVDGLVTAGGYNILDNSSAGVPALPEVEHRLWYQYYLHGDRGREGLTCYRSEFCELLWRLWSPTWEFDHDTFMRTASSFDNPDFVAVVVHSYRHRFGLVAGDPEYADVERLLADRPAISVPTVAVYGGANGVMGTNAINLHKFTGFYERLDVPNVGHNVPQEAPEAFAEAVLTVHRSSKSTDMDI